MHVDVFLIVHNIASHIKKCEVSHVNVCAYGEKGMGEYVYFLVKEDDFVT